MATAHWLCRGTANDSALSRRSQSVAVARCFESAYRLLPADGRILLHTILTHPPSYWAPHGIAITINTIKDWVDLRMTVQGMTQFVCQEVSKRLADPPISPSLRRDPWSYLLPEIRTEW